jgi:hypothetical protein
VRGKRGGRGGVRGRESIFLLLCLFLFLCHNVSLRLLSSQIMRGNGRGRDRDGDRDMGGDEGRDGDRDRVEILDLILPRR